MGSTSSNRLYALTGMLDPGGLYGGPVLSTITWSPQSRGILKPGWVTYPERLTDAGITWASYSDADSDSQDNPLVNFQQYYPGNPGVDSVRAARLSASLFGHSFQDFLADAAAGNLPSVSWVYAHINQSEHPPAAPRDGEVALSLALDALTANAAAWGRTAMFYTYDENGGYFDHVPPPTAPRGTAGEYVKGQTQPIGLGFRVPVTVISPFSRGGCVCSDTFDHTSQLRFLERRFGVEVPNLTAWRRAHTGDLTSAFNFAVDASAPSLPTPTPTGPTDHPECAGQLATATPYPFPARQALPLQAAGTRPRVGGPPAPEAGNPAARPPRRARDVGPAAAGVGGAAVLGAWWARRRQAVGAEVSPPE